MLRTCSLDFIGLLAKPTNLARRASFWCIGMDTDVDATRELQADLARYPMKTLDPGVNLLSPTISSRPLQTL